MKKILHIFPASTFLGPFVDFINSNFPPEEHVFYVLGDNSKYADLSKHSNVISVLKSEGRVRNARRLISLIRSSEKTIIHGLFDIRQTVLLNTFLFFTSKNNRPKFFWRIWGGDLYNHFLYPPSGRLKSLKKIRRTIHLQPKRRLLRHLYGIIAPVRGDFDFAVSKFRTDAKLFMRGVYGNMERELFDQMFENRANNSIPTILLGNSASATNEHFEALDLLSELRKISNFRVFCPLSYGDEDYATKVTEYGKRKLGDSFEPVMDFMKKEEYIQFLDSVDVAIMNHKRQQGLGNIAILLRLGKKIYMRRETSTFQHYTDLGVKVFDIADIRKNPEQTFVWSDELAINNREIIFDHSSKEQSISEWRAIFDS